MKHPYQELFDESSVMTFLYCNLCETILSQLYQSRSIQYCSCTIRKDGPGDCL